MIKIAHGKYKMYIMTEKGIFVFKNNEFIEYIHDDDNIDKHDDNNIKSE